MNLLEETELSEERKLERTRCENCGYLPLEHFEPCPVCSSEAFHETIRDWMKNEK